MSGDNDTVKKGFSGLSGLASDVSGTEEPFEPEPKPGAQPSMAHYPSPPLRKTASPQTERQTTNTPTPIETVGPGKSGSGLGGKWIFVIIGVAITIWFIVFGGRGGNKFTYTSPSSSQSYSAPRASSTLDEPKSIEPQSTVLQYTQPAIGTDNVLSVPEIRWCVREGIRIEAVRDLIDANSRVHEFNRIVNDYNSRCVSYRYRQGSQSRAERDVEPYRGQIVSEAMQEARRLGGDGEYQQQAESVSGSVQETKQYAGDEYRQQAESVSEGTQDARQLSPAPQSPYPAFSPNSLTSNTLKEPPAHYTREGQQLLSDLGYDPGPTDGVYGRRTAEAVKAFQRDAGIVDDGWIDQRLLSTLKTIRERQQKNSPESMGTNSNRNSSANSLTGRAIMQRISATASEQAQIENYCSGVTNTQDDRDTCITQQLDILNQSGGKPDLSNLPRDERELIDGYCSAVTSSPGNKYQCQRREMVNLRTKH